IIGDAAAGLMLPVGVHAGVGVMIILLGLWLLTPWIRRPLGLRSPTGITYAANPRTLAVPVILAILVALYSMTTDPHDLAGELPKDTVAANP
ncbi:hypothetical protein AB9F39_36015, partial [Rhizobium leguminosarum]|uniref:hypothetical protein n=1 Tax=Rhizobium leguminosarum TaxID=384 RepID=UPI003F9A8E9C